MHPSAGWRSKPQRPSLSEVHRSMVVPHSASFLRKLLAFAGPGFLVAVGYMDPGNWATDLAGGSKYNYALLSVIMVSNLMAILLQALSLKLGIATGRDLAQACRDHYSRPVYFVLWFICELAIAACDLAEVIGSAIALNLLFGIPLARGRLHHGIRRFHCLVFAKQGLSLHRSARHYAYCGRSEAASHGRSSPPGRTSSALRRVLFRRRRS